MITLLNFSVTDVRTKNFLSFHGFTVIEIIAALVVFSILAALAIPSFTGLLERQRLVALAESIYIDLVDARMYAIESNQTIYFNVNNGTSWCYGFDDNSDSCDCDTSDSCQLNGLEKRVNVKGYKSTRITTTISGSTATTGTSKNSFDPMRGIPQTSAQINLANSSGQTMEVNIRPTGRVFICSDSFDRYPACS